MNCIFTGEETNLSFEGLPIKKDVIKFIRDYRDFLRLKKRGISFRDTVNVVFGLMKRQSLDFYTLQSFLQKEVLEWKQEIIKPEESNS